MKGEGGRTGKRFKTTQRGLQRRSRRRQGKIKHIFLRRGDAWSFVIDDRVGLARKRIVLNRLSSICDTTSHKPGPANKTNSSFILPMGPTQKRRPVELTKLIMHNVYSAPAERGLVMGLLLLALVCVCVCVLVLDTYRCVRMCIQVFAQK